MREHSAIILIPSEEAGPPPLLPQVFPLLKVPILLCGKPGAVLRKDGIFPSTSRISIHFFIDPFDFFSELFVFYNDNHYFCLHIGFRISHGAKRNQKGILCNSGTIPVAVSFIPLFMKTGTCCGILRHWL